MKTKTILTGIVALATATLLAACSNNKTAPTTNPSKTEQSSNKTNDLQTFIKENKELIKIYRASFYLSGISQDFRKVENDADKKENKCF